MRAVIQRVREASVTIDGRVFSSIGRGILVYLGLHEGDGEPDFKWMIRKVPMARIFENEQGKLSHSVLEIRGEILMVSQFTLLGTLWQGNRPDMTQSMNPENARPLFGRFVETLAASTGLTVRSGQFGASMQVSSVNDGPVTLMLDSFGATRKQGKGEHEI